MNRIERIYNSSTGKLRGRRALLAGLLLVAGGCGLTMERAQMGYYFENPILNERWPGLTEVSTAPSVAVAARQESREKQVKEQPPKPTVAARSKPEQVAEKVGIKTPEQPEVLEKPRGEWKTSEAGKGTGDQGELVDSASRLVGIRDSFDSDSFLHHILFVNNVPVDDQGIEGFTSLFWERHGKKTPTAGIRPGQVMFLGSGGKPELAGIVEKVSGEGTFTIITVMGTEVKRITVTPGRPEARRDEATKKILNSHLTKGRLAGECYLGTADIATPDQTPALALP